MSVKEVDSEREIAFFRNAREAKNFNFSPFIRPYVVILLLQISRVLFQII